jgi:hypothetical protein
VAVEERHFSVAGIRPAPRHNFQIVEHELDMVRIAQPPSIIAARLLHVLNWLMPPRRQVRPPMRSVAQELEEVFPSHEH